MSHIKTAFNDPTFRVVLFVLLAMGTVLAHDITKTPITEMSVNALVLLALAMGKTGILTIITFMDQSISRKEAGHTESQADKKVLTNVDFKGEKKT